VVDLTEVQRGDRDGTYRFTGPIPASESGSYGFNVRVIPTHQHIIQDHELRLITWAK
jgi:hypothetical protein